MYEPLQPDPSRLVADAALLERARGCLLGQLAGDSLGALVEFQSAAEIARSRPGGPRELEDGGRWDTLAGQPTDDSELALLLARSIVDRGAYEPEAAAEAYAWWYASAPFDMGATTHAALRPAWRALESGLSAAQAAREAASRSGSQANGSLMRIAPLGIFGHGLPEDELADLARQDAALTHSHPVCQDAAAVFCVAIAAALREKAGQEATYEHALDWARSRASRPEVTGAIEAARAGPPEDFQTHMGWVLVALRNAFHQLLHAPDAAEGVVRTVAAGGDTDTNAAIAGALLGAVCGVESFPAQWRDRVLACRPEQGRCRRPRPRALWPVDALVLAERLAWLGMPAKGGTRTPTGFPTRT